MEATQARARQQEANRIRKNLLGDETLYIESIGKADMIHLAPHPGKIGATALRLIFGAAEDMTARGLGYIDSAVRTAKKLGIDQVHIIHANSVGSRINAIDKVKADDAAKRLHEASQKLEVLQENNDMQIIHAIDTPLDTTRFERLATQMFESDAAIADTLFQRGSRHGGDALAYTAVHFAFQDTNLLELAPLDSGMPAQIEAERIISIGCQKERTFYLARMAMRGFSSTDDNMIGETAQIFTRHVVPPYYFAKEGEPTLEEALDPMQFGLFEPGIEERLHLVGDASARRDLAHLAKVNSSGKAA